MLTVDDLFVQLTDHIQTLQAAIPRLRYAISTRDAQIATLQAQLAAPAEVSQDQQNAAAFLKEIVDTTVSIVPP